MDQILTDSAATISYPQLKFQNNEIYRYGSSKKKPSVRAIYSQQKSIKGAKVNVVSHTESSSITTKMTNLLCLVGKNHDVNAFHSIFSHFAPRVKAFVLRGNTDVQMAEDIVQETMTNVWLKAVQFDPSKAAASTWIFTIARNAKIDRLRKTKRPEPVDEDITSIPDFTPQADEIVSLDENASRLRNFLNTLPEEQEEVLRLAFFEEKTHIEISKILKLPLGTVKSRIRLAINRLRSELGEMK